MSDLNLEIPIGTGGGVVLWVESFEFPLYALRSDMGFVFSENDKFDGDGSKLEACEL